YTFTAMVGVFGPFVSWAVSVAMALWLHRLIRPHRHRTRRERRLLGPRAPRTRAAPGAVTPAVLPLTGGTFPFVSFGMTSLLVNMAFLALCLNVDVPVPATDGLELRAHDDCTAHRP